MANSSGGNIVEQVSFSLAIIMVILCIVGIVGNALSVFVFSRRVMRSSINVLLAALSLIDLLLLIVIVPIFALPLLNVNRDERLTDVSNVMVVYAYPISMILQTSSVWLCCLITVERYIAVVHPLRVAVYCSPRRARKGVAIVIFASLCYNAVRFWEYSLTSEERFGTIRLISIAYLRSNVSYWLWYGTVLYLLTQFLLPLVLFVALNWRVIITMMTARRERAILTTSERSEHRTAIMMVFIVVLFVACYTLSFVLNFIELIDSHFFDRITTSSFAYLLNDLSNTLVTLNSASTWLIYVLFCQRYRLIVNYHMTSMCPCVRSISKCDGYESISGRGQPKMTRVSLKLTPVHSLRSINNRQSPIRSNNIILTNNTMI